MSKKPKDICERTFNFSVRIVKFCSFLNQQGYESRDLARQLIRSGTSIGANVEESQAAQSTADFISKLKISLKEGRETRYWLRVLIASELVPESRISSLLNECNELINIIGSIIVKTQQNQKK
ncbi:MAG: four helix bundle protein [Crocosphaera sp.]|jgi:four helix bundle protein